MEPPGNVRTGPCNLSSIYGNCTAGGEIVFRNGTEATSPEAYRVSIPVGLVRLRFGPNYIRFNRGCYVEFSNGFAGDLAASFC